jgi:hypothetical protein
LETDSEEPSGTRDTVQTEEEDDIFQPNFDDIPAHYQSHSKSFPVIRFKDSDEDTDDDDEDDVYDDTEGSSVPQTGRLGATLHRPPAMSRQSSHRGDSRTLYIQMEVSLVAVPVLQGSPADFWSFIAPVCREGELTAM